MIGWGEKQYLLTRGGAWLCAGQKVGRTQIFLSSIPNSCAGYSVDWVFFLSLPLEAQTFTGRVNKTSK